MKRQLLWQGEVNQVISAHKTSQLRIAGDNVKCAISKDYVGRNFHEQDGTYDQFFSHQEPRGIV